MAAGPVICYIGWSRILCDLGDGDDWILALVLGWFRASIEYDLTSSHVNALRAQIYIYILVNWMLAFSILKEFI